jgi:hypothetical protein
MADIAKCVVARSFEEVTVGYDIQLVKLFLSIVSLSSSCSIITLVVSDPRVTHLNHSSLTEKALLRSGEACKSEKFSQQENLLKPKIEKQVA